ERVRDRSSAEARSRPGKDGAGKEIAQSFCKPLTGCSMSLSVPPLDVRTPESGDGGGGVHPPEIGGGGGRDPGDGSPDYEKRLQRARIGLICGVVSVSMLFLILTAVFLARQTSVALDSQGRSIRMWIPIVLPVRLLLWNTVILLCSSLTLELARTQVARDMVLAPLRAIVGNRMES